MKPIIKAKKIPIKKSRFHLSLILERENKLNKIKKVFKTKAIEGHVLGSVACGDCDPYSDLDIWITFKDKDFPRNLEKRIKLYKDVGDIIHICEPPQNAPRGGIFTSVLYKISKYLLIVDFYLAPQSTSFITTASKRLFSTTKLPFGKLELNSRKIPVSGTYRIDFLICFIFNSIKKLARKNQHALDALFREYNYLRSMYGITVEPLVNTENTFFALESVIHNINKVANKKQKKVLNEILDFISKVKIN